MPSKRRKKRKTYETDADRNREASVISYLEEKWDVTAKSLPFKYKFDACFVTDNGKKHNFNERYTIRAFAEIKCRNIKSTDFSTIVVELSKYLEAVHATNCTGIPVYIIYEFTDGIYYHELSEVNKDFYRYTMGGRKDRNDDQDHSPQLLIPIHLLVPIK